VLSLPLRQSDDCQAVVTLERASDEAFSLEDAETLRLTTDLCGPRLLDLHGRDRWVGARLAVKSRDALGHIVGPKHTWAKLLALAVLGVAAFLTFAEGDYTAEGTFALEAIDRRVLPAPYDGRVKEILAKPNQFVRANRDILGQLDTTDLDHRLSALRDEQFSYQKQVAAAQRDGETAKEQIAASKVRALQSQINLVQHQIDQATLRSPIDGVVISEDLERRIGTLGPVQAGDVLFEVAPLEALWADLFIPEDAIADVAVDQRGELAAAANPSLRVGFNVERIHPVAEVVDRKNVFRVRVRLDRTEPWMRPGMEGVGKINLGRAPYGWLWTRRVVNWVRMKLWL